MKRIFIFAGILVTSGLFIMCPKHESPAEGSLQVQIQGHVYDSQTQLPVAGNYVGLYYQIRTDRGLYALMDVTDTRTNEGGFYSLQGTIAAEACKAGSAKLYLMPVGDDNGTGTRIGCTTELQVIDLYK
jgi:hypothetical protein